VHIELTNHNDEAPMFLNAPYNVTLPEHSHEGTQVALVIAIILPTVSNGVICTVAGGL